MTFPVPLITLALVWTTELLKASVALFISVVYMPLRQKSIILAKFMAV